MCQSYHHNLRQRKTITLAILICRLTCISAMNAVIGLVCALWEIIESYIESIQLNHSRHEVHVVVGSGYIITYILILLLYNLGFLFRPACNQPQLTFCPPAPALWLIYSGPSFLFKALWIASYSSEVKFIWERSKIRNNDSNTQFKNTNFKSIFCCSRTLTFPNEAMGVLSVLHITEQMFPSNTNAAILNLSCKHTLVFTVPRENCLKLDNIESWPISIQSVQRLLGYKSLWIYWANEKIIFHTGVWYGKWRTIRRSSSFLAAFLLICAKDFSGKIDDFLSAVKEIRCFIVISFLWEYK